MDHRAVSEGKQERRDAPHEWASALILSSRGQQLRGLEKAAAKHARPHDELLAELRGLIGPGCPDREVRRTADLMTARSAITAAWQSGRPSKLPTNTILRDAASGKKGAKGARRPKRPVGRGDRSRRGGQAA